MPTLTAARAQYASAMYQELCLNLGTSDMLPCKVELSFISSILWCKATALIVASFEAVATMCHAKASMDPSLDIHIAFASLAFDVGATSAMGNTLALV